MRYNPQTDTLNIDRAAMEKVRSYLVDAIARARRLGKLPLVGYRSQDCKTESSRQAEIVEYCIIEAARHAGLDLGVERTGALDVSPKA